MRSSSKPRGILVSRERWSIVRSVDVAIIGAGPAGALCAWALARRGLDVMLVGEVKNDARVGEMLSAAAVRMLALAGISSATEVGEPVSLLRTAWGSGTALAHWPAAWAGGPSAEAGGLRGARVCVRPELDYCLQQEATRAGAHLHVGRVVKGFEKQKDTWQIQISHKEQLLEFRSAFLIEATGQRARSLAWPDLHRHPVDRMVAIHAEIERPETFREGMVVIEACREGWWYAAPSRPSHYAVVFFTDADLVAAGDTHASFAEVATRTIHIAPFAERVLSSKIVSARTSIRSVLWRDRWIAIGDAAWFLDPLSGSGIHRALADGLAAADVVADYLAGETMSARAYATAKARAFFSALKQRQAHYAAEQRWPSSPFWLRRHTEHVTFVPQ
ncbi:FAD-dependent monooxygenase [Rhizobium ruizarguesonis]|uniref:FAD-dependent monooxygenase n=1 Tax=Rhizobium ruizarguesonis TaxID=2081791 RepID=UPI001CF4AACC|nr:FAD-dependent monooxygenase [Rhizobium ruizarguesonis]MCB2399357.1 FAD-dependent monooxygenase [Rhizobium ruizarguesonis]